MRQARPPARFELTPTVMQRGAPRLGEHTDEILRELGYSADRIEELRANRVIGPSIAPATAA